jgi:hypothetical protein
MATRDEHTRARQPRQSVDALGDLFDGLAPEERAEAERVLLESGRDPARVGRAMKRLAEGKLAAHTTTKDRARGLPLGRAVRRRVRSGSPSRLRRYAPWAAIAALAVATWNWAVPSPRTGGERRPSELSSLEVHREPRIDAGARPGEPESDGAGAATRTKGEGADAAANAVEEQRLEPAERREAERPAVRSEESGGEAVAVPHRSLPALGAGDEGVVARLDRASWQLGTGRLPEEILQRYRDGEWWHVIYRPGAGARLQNPRFLEASVRNEGRYRIGARGEIVEAETERRPISVYGAPFPTVRSGDPDAGAKVVWNYFYQSYQAGDRQFSARLDQVKDRAVEATWQLDFFDCFLDGTGGHDAHASGAEEFLSRQLIVAREPAELRATSLLSHRFGDPAKRDAVWSYVPALRRVRTLSPANRADAMLGSDLAQDDGTFFDGKPEDFTWRLAGEGEMLMLYDRTAVAGDAADLHELPDGGFERVDSARARFAYQEGAAEGHALRPLESEVVLVARPVWIVEGTPKDRYYPYGKLVLRIDRQTWRGTYSSKYGWQGELLASHFEVGQAFLPVGGESLDYAASYFRLSQNVAAGRGTATYPSPADPARRSGIEHADGTFTIAGMIEGEAQR